MLNASLPRDAAVSNTRRISLDLFNLTLGVGIALLMLPWAIRSFSEQTGMLTQVRITPVLLAGTLLLMFCAMNSLLSGRTPIRQLTPAYQVWVAFLAVFFASMVFIGILRSNPVVLMVQEGLVLAIFLSGLILGASERNWRSIDRGTVTSLALIGIPAVIMGYMTIGSMDMVLLRRGTIYSASVILLPATFYMLALPRLRSRRLVFIAVLAFATWTVLQLLFLKRAPLLRAGATVGLSLLFLPIAWRSKRFALWLGTGVMAISAASLLFISESGRELRDSMLERFEVFDLVEQFVVGATVVQSTERYDVETFRFREASIMIDHMTWPERIYGIGAGGYISAPELAQWDLSLGDRIIPSAKNALHVGAFWSFVKGGVILFIAFQVGLIVLLVSWSRMRNDPLAVNCWVFVALNFAFSFLEGFWMQPASEGLTFMMGAAIGYCVLRASQPFPKVT
jgi:hypothetical protein